MPRGEGVKHLKDLFQKYRDQLIAPEGTVLEASVEVIEDVVGVRLTREQLTYVPSTKTLSIKASGVIKQEVLFQKEEILAHMKGRLGVKAAPSTIL